MDLTTLRMEFNKTLKDWIDHMGRKGVANTRNAAERKHTENLPDLIDRYLGDDYFTKSFQQFALVDGRAEFQSTSWEHIKTRLDTMFYENTPAPNKHDTTEDQLKLITYIWKVQEIVQSRGLAIQIQEIENQKRRTLIKMFLECGEYKDVEKLKPFPDDISDAKNIVRLVIHRNKETLITQLGGMENFYIVHAIIGSRRYGMIPFELLRQLMERTTDTVDKTIPFLKAIEQLYSRTPRQTPLSLAKRLQWLMYLQELFPEKIPHSLVIVNEEYQSIRPVEKSVDQIQDVEEFQYIVKRFIQPIPLPNLEGQVLAYI